MKRILVIRFSSMGDVLLTAPVLTGVLDSKQDVEIHLLTKSLFSGYFSGIPGINTFSVDTKTEYKGIKGIYLLSREIRKNIKPDVVIDLHGVLRSRLLSFFLRLSGLAVFTINKGRKEKKRYISGRDRKPLKHTCERYSEVFKKAGIESKLVNYPFQIKKKAINDSVSPRIKIGLAPFARHDTKTWPIDYILELMSQLHEHKDVEYHLYGGKMDAEKLQFLNFNDSNISVHAGKLSPEEELDSISKLDLFLSMDSANMHLADLLGIPVISIWGATHPDLGFRPLNQPIDNIILTNKTLICQPCSVYGGKKCSLKESKHKCLISIPPALVATKIISSLSD